MKASKTRKISATALFGALAVVLGVVIKIPAPYLPFLIYSVWEVPIMAAFLIYGWRVGIAVALVNFAALQVIFPGPLSTGPLYNFIAILSTMLGVYMAGKGLSRTKAGVSVVVAAATILGAVLRTAVMTVVNYTVLPLPPPIGFYEPMGVVLLQLPLIGLFNATIVLYTVPLAYAVLKVVSSRYRMASTYGGAARGATPTSR